MPTVEELFPGRKVDKVAASSPTTQDSTDPNGEPPAWWQFLAHRFMQGAAVAKGAQQDMSIGAMKGEARYPILGIARGLGVPREWVNKISPVKLEGDDYGAEAQLARTTYAPLEHHRSAIVEHVGEGFKGMGGALMTPVGGPLKAGVIAATGYGSGALGDLGRNIGEGSQRIWNNLVLDKPGAEGPLAAAGQFVGSLIGGQLGIVKANTIKEVAIGTATGTYNAAKGTLGAAQSVSSAYSAATAAKRAGDQRSLINIFMDDYKLFQGQKTSSDMITKMVAGKLASALEFDPAVRENAKEWLLATKKISSPEELADFQAKFNAAQVTKNESLAALTRERAERSAGLGESSKLETRQVELKEALATKGNKFGVRAWMNSKDVDASFRDLQDATKLQLDVNDIKTAELKATFTHQNATDSANQGKLVKASHEAEKAVSTEKVDQLYGTSRNEGDVAGTKYDLSAVYEKANEILGTASSQVTGGAQGSP